MNFDEPLSDLFWEDLRASTLKLVRPIFLEALLAGAHAGMLLLPKKGKRDAQPNPPRRRPGAIAPVRLLPAIFDEAGLNALAEQFITTYSDDWWAALSTTRRDALRVAILRAQEEGLQPAAIMRELDGLFDPAAVQRIAVTEMTRLIGEGARLTYGAAGFPKWRWNTVNDALVDPFCRDLSGRVFTMAIPFQPAHPNCRCFPSPAGEIDIAAA